MSTALFAFADGAAAAARLAERCGIALHRVEVRRFPDGESLVRVEGAAETAILFRSLDDPNAKLVELLLAASALREKYGSQSVVHAEGGANCANLLVQDGDEIAVGGLRLLVLYTPGHTNGDVSYLMDDRVFTGDALLIGGCGRTDFQAGSAPRLYDSIHTKLFTLAPDTLVYPGHDYKGRTVSTIAEELRTNPRLGAGKSKEEFVQIMNSLNLPYPKFIDRALPANQACGRETIPQG